MRAEDSYSVFVSVLDDVRELQAAVARLRVRAALRTDAVEEAFWAALADLTPDSPLDGDPVAEALRRPFLPRLAEALHVWKAAGCPAVAAGGALARKFAAAEDGGEHPFAAAAGLVALGGCASEVLASLYPRGLQILLGLTPSRTTLPALPPPAARLAAAYGAPHGNRGLTVGARARAKHAARAVAGDGGFWGVVRGNVAEVNARAAETLRMVLCGAVWVNVFALPHGIHVVELRVASGYGMRFLADGSAFRGFLEPPMEGGHEVGWRH